MNKISIRDVPESFPKEAIWRGKYVDGGGNVFWHFGYPLNRETILPIRLMNGSLFHELETRCAIHPGTLSQCTGIEIDGQLLFAGDILKSDHFTEANGRRHYLRHYVEWSPKFHGWRARNISGGEDGSPQLWVYLKNLLNPRIVGTIWD